MKYQGQVIASIIFIRKPHAGEFDLEFFRVIASVVFDAIDENEGRRIDFRGFDHGVEIIRRSKADAERGIERARLRKKIIRFDITETP